MKIKNLEFAGFFGYIHQVGYGIGKEEVGSSNLLESFTNPHGYRLCGFFILDQKNNRTHYAVGTVSIK
jgi:hypothetical protein